MYALDSRDDAINVDKYSERLKSALETKLQDTKVAQGWGNSYLVRVLSTGDAIKSSDGIQVSAGSTRLESAEFYPAPDPNNLYPGFGFCTQLVWQSDNASNPPVEDPYEGQLPEASYGEGIMLWNPFNVSYDVGSILVAIKTPSGFIAVAKCGMPDGIQFVATNDAAFTTTDTDVVCTFDSCSYSGIFGITTGTSITIKNPGTFSANSAGKKILAITTGDELHMIHVETESGGGTGYGTLSSALATTDATASIILDASSPLEPSASITATNWVDMEGASGAKCIVSKTGSEYILIQLACP